jgi:hypothetical protein
MKTVKPMKILKNADKFLNGGQNMYLPKDHPSYSAIEALLYTKNVALSGDTKVFDVIVEAQGDKVWIWIETDDGRDNGYSFTKDEAKELLSRPTAYMQILRNASTMLAEVDQLLMNSEADMIVRGILREFGIVLGSATLIVDILIDHELVHVFFETRDLIAGTLRKQNYQFKVEFVSDYERLVTLKSDLHVLQTKFALA